MELRVGWGWVWTGMKMEMDGSGYDGWRWMVKMEMTQMKMKMEMDGLQQGIARLMGHTSGRDLSPSSASLVWASVWLWASSC